MHQPPVADLLNSSCAHCMVGDFLLRYGLRPERLRAPVASPFNMQHPLGWWTYFWNLLEWVQAFSGSP